MRMRVFFAALVLAAIACGKKDGAGPGSTGGPSLSIVAGGTATDTIGAILTQGLVVQATGANGRPRSGLVVRFESPFAGGSASPGVMLARSTSSNFALSLADTTDAAGRLLVIVRMGLRAGPSAVLVTLPEFGIVDSARYVATAGRPHSLFFTAGDTAIGVAKSRTLAAEARDRNFNVTNEPISFALVSSNCSLSGVVVTTTGIGRCKVAASLGSLRDTATISVLPSWDIAAVRVPTFPYPMLRINLESGALTVLGTTEDSQGDIIVRPSGLMLYTSANAIGLRLPSGADTLGFVSGPPWSYQRSPRLSADNQNIFFVGSTVETGIFRSSISGANPLPLRRIDDVNSIDLSPDGSTIVFDRNGALFLMGSSGTPLTPLSVLGHRPRWSPLGDRIAFVRDQVVYTMSATGDDVRRISPPDLYDVTAPVDWSPDGQWVLAMGQTPVLFKADGTDYVRTPLYDLFRQIPSASFVR